MSEEKMKVEFGGEEQEVDLLDIANIDMTEIKEFEGGFEPTPKGVFKFGCENAELKTMDTKNGKSPVILFELKVLEVLTLVDDSIDGDALVDKWVHRETLFIKDVEKSVGQAKAIMSNAGMVKKGTLTELLDAFVGTEFYAPIKQRKNPNDTDQIFANLIVKKITPVQDEEAAEEVG